MKNEEELGFNKNVRINIVALDGRDDPIQIQT